MSDWLFSEDNYCPKSSNDRHLAVNSVRLIRMINRLRPSRGSRTGIYKVSSLVKIITSLLLIMIVTLGSDQSVIVLILACKLLELALLERSDIVRVVSIGAIAVLLTTITLLPAYFVYGYSTVLTTIIRVAACVLIVNIFACSSKWRRVIQSFRWLKVPNFLILLLDLTLKYIFILGKVASDLFLSLRKRSIGTSADNYVSLGGVVGMLFIKSKRHADYTWQAMQSRGFSGNYTGQMESMNWQSVLYLVSYLGLVLVVMLLG